MTIKEIEESAVSKIRDGFIPVCWIHPDDVKAAMNNGKLRLSREQFEEISTRVENHLVDDNYWETIRMAYDWVKE